MKNLKLTIILFFLFSVTNNLFAQDNSVNGKIYPEISISNIIDWLNMDRVTWQSKMQKYDFDNENFAEGSPKFTIYLNSESTLLLIVSKKYDLIEISLINFTDTSYKKPLINLYNELEPYYESSNNNANIFSMNYNGNKYSFYVDSSKESDLIFIKKIKK